MTIRIADRNFYCAKTGILNLNVPDYPFGLISAYR